MPYKPVAKKKAAPKGGGKAASGINLYTPVKQSTIDKIKGMGMSAALKKAGSSKNAEFVQGVKRMYGADRLKAAMKKANKPVARSADEARSMASKKTASRPVAKSADEARARATKSGMPGAGPLARMGAKPAASKKVDWRKEGILPAIKAGSLKGKKVVKGKVSGPGYFKS